MYVASITSTSVVRRNSSLTERNRHESAGNGAFDHIAFTCVGLNEMLERLKNHDIEYSVTEVPGSETRQVFLRDPAGIALELNFATP